MQPLEVSANNAWCELEFSPCSTFYVDGVPYSYAFFGAGTGPIYLDDVACTSSDSQLLECSSRPILTHNCLHSADAGVGCKGNLINLGYETCQICFQQEFITCYYYAHL